MSGSWAVESATGNSCGEGMTEDVERRRAAQLTREAMIRLEGRYIHALDSYHAVCYSDDDEATS